MDAALVYATGDDIVRIPEGMGTPTEDQMQGTVGEQLGELACRICYDSLGLNEQGRRKGRSSEQLHKHILEVINLSVYEHINFTVGFRLDEYFYSWFGGETVMHLALAMLNRKGVWVEYAKPRAQMTGGAMEITLNLRTFLEWERYNTPVNQTSIASSLWHVLSHYVNGLCPQIVPYRPDDVFKLLLGASYLKQSNLTANQAHVSLWLYGSRGFTHEQVRHRFFMSQRSTRYVDEDGSPYIEHPLITKFLDDQAENAADRLGVARWIQESTIADRKTYRALVEILSDYCGRNGLDKTSARKQARGASRGYLGNALASEMIFTASVANWQWILSQRKSKAADAEIRQVYTPGLAALQESRFSSFFSHYTTIPSPDGLGTILA